MFISKRPVTELWVQLAIIAVVMLLVMTFYEWLKQSLIPDISIWGSHFITIVFNTLLAVVVSYCMLLKFHREYDQRVDEMDRRKVAQAALHQSEERWRNIVKYANVGVFQVTPEGRIILVNEKLARLFGYDDSADFLNRIENITQLYARPEDRPAVIDQLASDGFVDRIEIEFKNRDNESVWVLLSCRTYQNPNDNWVHEGFMIDITGRKRLEAEKDQLVTELEASLTRVKLLSGMLPICSNCKKVRDDQGYWKQIEEYIESHSDARFSHSCCPECAQKLYPQFVNRIPK